jgi:pSer/pThr/pTyr-binding forkhead associated (FHA) protein
MSELTLTLLRLGFLALLWILVLSVVAVLRRDLFGTQVTRRAAPDAATPRPPRRRPPSVEFSQPHDPRTLVVTEGSLRGTTIALGQAPILIGRAPECTLVLDDDFASGRHARFCLQSGVWMLEDLGSTNGTFLGRSKVESPTVVDPGTPVRIGRTVLELRR